MKQKHKLLILLTTTAYICHWHHSPSTIATTIGHTYYNNGGGGVDAAKERLPPVSLSFRNNRLTRRLLDPSHRTRIGDGDGDGDGANEANEANEASDELTIMCISIRGGGAAVSGDSDSDGDDDDFDFDTRLPVDNNSSHNGVETRMPKNRSSKTFSKRMNRRRQQFMNKYQSSLSSSSSSLSLSPPISFNSTQIGEKLSIWKNETTEKAKKIFLDQITFASTILLKSEAHFAMVKNATRHSIEKQQQQQQQRNKRGNKQTEDDQGEDDEEEEQLDDDEITLQSDLLRQGRSFHIVTTAAIPWFTGTAVNPLLRAAYLCRMVKEINEKYDIDNDDGIDDDDMEVVPVAITKNGTTSQTSNETITTEIDNDSKIQRVTLVIPWLELEEDRLELYGTKYNFTSPEEQEIYIRNWLREEAQMPDEADEQTGLQIIFYPARYHSGLKSIFAMGDIVSLISDDGDADICILEEPEHLNFYRAPGDGWTQKFDYVIGIIHTNYVEYASAHYSGLWTAPAIRAMSSAMVRAYCHVVIKLSNTLQTFAQEKERTSNVHGVRSEFLQEGMRRSSDITKGRDISPSKESSTNTGTEAYFIGKLLWTKGLDGILEMQNYYKRYTGSYFPIDIYGNGPNEKAIKRAFHGRGQIKINQRDEEIIDNPQPNEILDSYNQTLSHDEMFEPDEHSEKQKGSKISHHVAKLSKHIQATTRNIKTTTESLDLELPQSLNEYRRTPIPATFPGRVDHATLKQYKVFVNPSLSEVLCTTTAEALAMGKFVIIPEHPSNHFFMQFPNCLAYRNKLEFVANLSWALSHEPEPLSAEQQRLFTWEAATDRLVEASAITRREAKERQKLGTSRLDERIAWFHNEMGNGTKGDILRKVLGAGPAAEQVKYSKHQSSVDNTNNEDDDNSGGLSMKFVGSSLADAMRKTFSNGILVPAGTLL